MKDEKKKTAAPQEQTPGVQRGDYENATPENVKQATKEQNNIGAPGQQY